jgi:Putative peptidoglycan binding domain
MSTQAEQPPDLAFARPPPMVDDTDEPFRQSLAHLSRQLASRVPIEPPEFDPKVADELPPEPREPARQYRRHRPWLAVLALLVGFGVAGVIHAMIGAPAESPQPPRTVAAVVPQPPEPVPPPNADALAPNRPVTVDPPPPTVPPIVIAAPETAVPPKGKLEAYEVMEIQTRLKAAGLNPGPLDGVAGGQTASAIREYEASKGKPSTGKPDRALLQQLRKEPAKPQQ